MKNLIAVAAIVCAFATGAQAEDVAQSELASLGLGGLEVMSEAEGMEVRGKSSNALSTSLSLFSAVLFDPASGNSATISGADFASASAENAGLNASSTVTASTATGILAPATLSVTTGGVNFSAVFGALNVSGLTTAQGF